MNIILSESVLQFHADEFHSLSRTGSLLGRAEVNSEAISVTLLKICNDSDVTVSVYSKFRRKTDLGIGSTLELTAPTPLEEELEVASRLCAKSVSGHKSKLEDLRLDRRTAKSADFRILAVARSFWLANGVVTNCPKTTCEIIVQNREVIGSCQSTRLHRVDPDEFVGGL